jgi:hypothetical protein
MGGVQEIHALRANLDLRLHVLAALEALIADR